MQAQHRTGRNLDRGDRFLARARTGIDTGAGAITGVGKLGDGRLGGVELLAGVAKQIQGLVQSLHQRWGISLAHLLYQLRVRAGHARGVLEGTSRQGLRQDSAVIAHHGEDFGEDVRQVGDARHRRIVVSHADRHRLRVHHLGHAHDLGEGLNPLLRYLFTAGLALGGVVIGNSPSGAAEKILLGVIPAGLGGTRHWVAAYVARLHSALQHLLAHGRLNGNDVRNAAAGRVFLNGIEDASHSAHRHGYDDKRVIRLRAGQNGGKIVGDVKALLDGGTGARSGVVVSKNRVIISGEIAQQRAADEAEADNADGALNILRTHDDNCGTTRLISRGMSNENYSFAVTVARAEGQWLVRSFNDDFEDPQTSINAVRSLRSEGAAFALLCVEDAYFIAVRPAPGGVKMLISDATYGVDDDFAADFMDINDHEIPDVDPDEAEPFGEGDFDIFADLGLSEDQVGYIIDNDEDWPSDMLLRIAGELGFGDELEDVIDNA